ncbi:MAG TPA: endonuclease/exonuclease/phosphatase family protein [Magnetospirillum sp.]|nr:endonuclease/exonuclease/phosphatase family protein [Magnetospirillum sp.]
MPDDPSPRLDCLSVSLASYNIHRGFGTDGRYAPERTAEVIEALDADVIGLQEVDMRLLVDGRAQLDFLAESLSLNAVPGPNVKGRRGKFGNALLTRWPVRSVCRTDLTVGHFEPRGAIMAELDVGGHALRVVVTHLGLNAAERRLQVRTLMGALEDAGSDAVPTVIMGDFNEWRPTRGALKSIDRRFGVSLMPRTFPSRLPLLPLDRIWAWPAAGLKRLSVYATPLSRVTSDHLPLRAEVAWESQQLPGGWRGGLTITKV